MSSHEQKTHEEPVADAAETLNTAAEQPETGAGGCRRSGTGPYRGTGA